MITINYNSSRILDVVLESIKSILNLNYRELKVILVDNGPTDESFNEIVKMVKTLSPKDVEVLFLKLPKNYGFAVANNVAFNIACKSGGCIALINNDLAPEPSSLKELVKFLEENEDIAGVQGKILNWDGTKIDSAGCFLTRFGGSYVRGRNLRSIYAIAPPM